MDRPKENLRTEQKATIEMMYADGKDEAAIAKAIGKRIDTVRHYIDGHIFELRDKSGRMPDGTPKAGRVVSGQWPVAGNDECAKEEAQPRVRVVEAKEQVQEAAPEPVPEPVQPWEEWMFARITTLRDAMMDNLKTLWALPEEWLREYNDELKLVEERKA